MTQAFDLVNRFLGWGEPESGVWFVGLEEASGWAGRTLEDVAAYYRPLGEVERPRVSHENPDFGKKGSAIRNKTARILQPLSAEGVTHDPTWYRDRKLWKVGSKTFQANLFPIGKSRRRSWEPALLDLFGFSAEEQGHYLQVVRETRFPRLRSLWEESKPQATVCFGKEGWPYCREIFALGESATEVVSGKVLAYVQQHVVLMPFFAYYHVTNADADAVSRLLKGWGVALP